MSLFNGLGNFLLVWFGQVVSGVGSRLSTFALGIWVFTTTGSSTQFALIFVALAVPPLLLAPFAGALVDRWDRRLTMIGCDLISALITLVLAGLLLIDQLAIWHIYLGVGITSIATAFHMPAYASSIPLLVEKEKLPRINGMVQMSYAIGQILGPLLAGVLVNLISLEGVLFVDALTFLAAVFALYRAKVPKPNRHVTDEDANLWKEAAVGWRYVKNRPGLMGLLTVLGVNNFFFGIASIAITPLVLSFSTTEMLGIQFAMGGVGFLLGGLLIATWGGPKSRINGVLLSSVIAGVCIAAHGVIPSFILIAFTGFFLFMTIPVINASNDSLWQSKVPTELHGRCFAIQRVLTQSAMPVGIALAGPLMEFVFEPTLRQGGSLVDSVGEIIGVGPGRGTGLLFIVLGLLMVLVAILAYGIKAVRNVERLPNVLSDSGSLKKEPIENELPA